MRSRWDHGISAAASPTGFFLKQIGSLQRIASDMRVVLHRTTLREAFKKSQLLPELPATPADGTAIMRSLDRPMELPGKPARAEPDGGDERPGDPLPCE
jgi:hypothetical protein